ncbi:metallophosphoesterase family protein [Arenibaculum pallidiluteum]|uniref:metallophosphoesterase family protein n=1 Tax=Arenibaculum pallidiluteum TaxID=2812559 RepID=UPI001A97499B|nr:DNA repair exonuclease [Arenibaculum pallidiluteum]
MKFLHAADIHLDSPLVGLEAYEGAPVERLRGATRRALEAMIDLALAEAVDFVVIAGDLYDGDWRDFNTGLFFVRQVVRLHERGIPLFLLHGNHDAESQITRRLPLPDTVKVFPSRRAETFRLPALRTALHGQSFARREVSENLAATYPRPVEGWFNLGVLHTALDGREGHAPYAPCALAGLLGHGYDYWALGHVHRREVLSSYPHVVFPGNLQGRHIRETGAKGCTLVTVEDGRIAALEHRSVDVLRWELVEIDLGGLRELGEVQARARAALGRTVAAAEGRVVTARLRLVGATAAHGALLVAKDRVTAELRALSYEFGADALWIEKVRFETRAERDAATLAARPDAIGSLVRTLADAPADPDLQAALGAELEELLARLPSEALEGEGEALALLREPGHLAELLDEARELVLARLVEVEVAP